MTNSYGLDADYFIRLFASELNPDVVRNQNPQDLARVLARAARTACEEVLAEPEFRQASAAPEQDPVGQWSDDDGLTWCDGSEQELASARAAGWMTRRLYKSGSYCANQDPVAEVRYMGYEPTNHLNWLGKNNLQLLPDGTKLYAHADPSDVAKLRADLETLERKGAGFSVLELFRSGLRDQLKAATQRADAAERQVADLQAQLVGVSLARDTAERKLSELESYLPTPAATNALPEGLRRYVRDLQTLCDPSGIVAENTMLRDQTKQLDAMIGRLKRELSEAVGLLRRARRFVEDWDDDSQEFIDLCGEIDNVLASATAQPAEVKS